MSRWLLSLCVFVVALLSWVRRADAIGIETVRSRLVQIMPELDPVRTSPEFGVGLLLESKIILTARHVLFPDCSVFGRALPSCRHGSAGVTGYTIRNRQGKSEHWTAAQVRTEELGSGGSHPDVALLILPDAFQGISGDSLISSAHDDDIASADLHILSLRPGTGDALRPFEQDPGASTPDPRTSEIWLRWTGSAGDSGAPLFSKSYHRVLGVYVGSELRSGAMRGIAITLSDSRVRALLDRAGVPPAPLTQDLAGFDYSTHFTGVLLASWGHNRSLETQVGVKGASLDGSLGVMIDLFGLGHERRSAFALWAALTFTWASYRNEYRGALGSQVLTDEEDTVAGFGGEAAPILHFCRLRTLSLVILPVGVRGLRVWYETPPSVEPALSVWQLFTGGRLLFHTTAVRPFVEARASIEWAPNSHYRYTGLDGTVRRDDSKASVVYSLGGGLGF